MIEIKATQKFIKDIFQEGNYVTPLEKYIIGIGKESYKNNLLPAMMGFPKSEIVIAKITKDGFCDIALEMNKTLYTYSPAMFQEFWIYALFQTKYAEAILTILPIDTITRILDNAFSKYNQYSNILLNRIANGDGCPYSKLKQVFDFDKTKEKTEYWVNISNQLSYHLTNN